jgi:hypothetical protein
MPPGKTFSTSVLQAIIGHELADEVYCHHRKLQNRDSAARKRKRIAQVHHDVPLVSPRITLYFELLNGLETAHPERALIFRRAQAQLRTHYGPKLCPPVVEQSMIEILLEYGSLFDFYIRR